MIKYQEFIYNTNKELMEYLKKNKINSITIGLSGGIDSAVSLGIISQLKDIKINCYFIDIHSNNKHLEDAKMIANFFNCKLEVVKLNEVYDNLIDLLDIKNVVQQGNIKSRLRMMFLYNKSFENKSIVIGNSNYDELYLGYFTKYGDAAADYLLLNNLLKCEVILLAKYFNLPKHIIEKEPSADLYDKQTDEQELGLFYKEIDDYFLNKNNVSQTIKEKIINIHNQNKHKNKIKYNSNFLLNKKDFFNE